MTVNVTLTDHQLAILDSALAFYLEHEYFASRPGYHKEVKELKEKVSLERGILVSAKKLLLQTIKEVEE